MKEKRTAKQLQEIVAGMMTTRGVRPDVHKDPAYGWHVVVFGSDPGAVQRGQSEVEQLLPTLRERYDLAG